MVLHKSVIEGFLIKWIEDTGDEQADELMEHILEVIIKSLEPCASLPTLNFDYIHSAH